MFTASLVILVYILIEMIAAGGLILLRRRGLGYEPITLESISVKHRRILEQVIEGRTAYTRFSRTLGWSIVPGGSSPPDYRANSAGIRSDREYALVPPPGTIRIAAFGDSFTHGDEVANRAAWAAVLEAETAGIEALNFGVAGFGVDQALLRFRLEGAAYRPHIVLIGLMPENVFRHLNVYRPFLNAQTGLPLAKPRFVLSDGKLKLLPNPVHDVSEYGRLLTDPEPMLKRFGEHDPFFQRWRIARRWDVSPAVRVVKLAIQTWASSDRPANVRAAFTAGSEPFMLAAALLETFATEVRQIDAKPLILLFPGRSDIQAVRDGGQAVYHELRAYLEAKRLPVLDVMTAFEPCEAACDAASLAPGHYSARGSRLVAKRVRQWLVEAGWLPTAGNIAGAADLR